MSTKTRFEKEAKGNSEMAYSMFQLCIPAHSSMDNISVLKSCFQEKRLAT